VLESNKHSLTSNLHNHNGLPWWSLRGEQRAFAKAKSNHSEDDQLLLATFPRMVRQKRSRPSKPKPETIDKYRERLFRMAAEIRQLQDRQRREEQ
jgi:hypothetical protein